MLRNVFKNGRCMFSSLVLVEYMPNIYVTYKSFISDAIIQQSIGGVMVSIVAFQAVDLGSIPSQCIF